MRIALTAGGLACGDTVKAASPGVQDWLYECQPAPGGPTDPRDTTGPPRLDHEARLNSVRNITATARRAPDGTAVTRMFTARGWALLPAVAAWYGITPREREVVRHALEGLAAKNIARHLELSQHTVNDHLGAGGHSGSGDPLPRQVLTGTYPG
ncbi:helix-turn-helix transcriptional regulator [Streptomyces sp. NPDC059697]|uniref:helix-turn-helix transcriptional regulator n=1 Tax=Streptomyces sp. NPDC059697 TaxID=3346912 RepID=UPI003699796A